MDLKGSGRRSQDMSIWEEIMRISRLTTFAFVIAATAATCAAAAGGGPSPGVSFGAKGVSDGSRRYVALPAGRRTVVQAIQMRGGRVVSFNSIPGTYGIPQIAFDGSTGGLSWDGSTLVLASSPSGPGVSYSRFAVLDTGTLRAQQTVALKGTWSYDALSPDASTLYLIQHVANPSSATSRYYVRAYDLLHQRLLRKVIFDTREKWGLMSGSPITRVASTSGRWVYTLYTRPGGHPFVHALDAANRRAVCIDLPWRGSQAPIWRMKLRLTDGQSKLVVQGKKTPRRVIDTRTFRVSAT
jgi:hypothetical protein